MDPIATERFEQLTLDTRTVDIDVTQDTLERYLGQNMRMMVFLLASSVFRDSGGSVVHRKFIEGDVIRLKRYVRLLVDHWVRGERGTRKGTDVLIQAYILRLRWVIMCRFMSAVERIPRAAAGMIYLSARLVHVVGFTGDISDNLKEEARDILAYLGMYARRSRIGARYDYPGADGEGELEAAIQSRKNPQEGGKLNNAGKLFTSGDEWTDGGIASSGDEEPYEPEMIDYGA